MFSSASVIWEVVVDAQMNARREQRERLQYALRVGILAAIRFEHQA